MYLGAFECSDLHSSSSLLLFGSVGLNWGPLQGTLTPFKAGFYLRCSNSQLALCWNAPASKWSSLLFSKIWLYSGLYWHSDLRMRVGWLWGWILKYLPPNPKTNKKPQTNNTPNKQKTNVTKYLTYEGDTRDYTNFWCALKITGGGTYRTCFWHFLTVLLLRMNFGNSYFVYLMRKSCSGILWWRFFLILISAIWNIYWTFDFKASRSDCTLKLW